MFPENENIYPTKPEKIQVESGSKLIKLLVSMALFFVVFITLFSDSYVFVSEIVIVLLLHELGHLLAMKIFGYRALNMLFIPMLGAMVSGNKLKASQHQKVIISFMGPLPGILLGCGLFLWMIFNTPNVLAIEFALLLISINILNMIPLDPLDGGNIIESLFFPSNNQYRMYFTLISSIFIILIGVYFEFFPILIFGFFMAFKVRSYQKNKLIQDDLDEMNFNYKKEYNDLTDGEYWTLRRVFLNNNPKIKDIIPDDNSVWENEKLIVEQVSQILRFDVSRDLSITKKLFYVILLISSLFFPVYLIFKNYSIIEWYLENAGV